MIKKIFIIAACLLTFTVARIQSARAMYSPTALPNNIFGIHIIDSNDISAAARLVNSAHNDSADWGYVTLVIAQNDRNSEKWKTIFTNLRNNHLIPIVRLATYVKEGAWVRPDENDAQAWADFLDSLPWPIQNRYVILFNEPNQKKEWGGQVDAPGYATVAQRFIHILKEKTGDFFVLPAGMDLYALNSGETRDAAAFWQEMETAKPGILRTFDGWVSHSYPAYDYSGSPYDTGRRSVVGYRWEKEYLSQMFGVRSDLPVFITETGWAQNSRLSRETIANYYQIAFDEVWRSDPSVVAVTPFLLNYQDGLFAKFSWRKLNSEEFYPQYHIVRELAKRIGEPLMAPLSKFGALLNAEQAKKLARYQAMLP